MSERECTRVESTKGNRYYPFPAKAARAETDLSSADPMISEEQAREREGENTEKEEVRTRKRRLVQCLS